MIGGLFTSFLMELLVYPVLFHIAKRWQLRRELEDGPETPVALQTPPASAREPGVATGGPT